MVKSYLTVKAYPDPNFFDNNRMAVMPVYYYPDLRGAYFDARDEADLERVLEQSVLLLTYKVFDDKGELIGEGEVDGKPAEVPAGAVSVRLDTVPPVVIRDIQIGRLTETTVKLAQRGGNISSTVKQPIPVQLPAAPSSL